MFELSYGWRDTGGMWHFRHNDTASHCFRRKKVFPSAWIWWTKPQQLCLQYENLHHLKSALQPFHWLRDRCWRNWPRCQWKVSNRYRPGKPVFESTHLGLLRFATLWDTSGSGCIQVPDGQLTSFDYRDNDGGSNDSNNNSSSTTTTATTSSSKNNNNTTVPYVYIYIYIYCIILLCFMLDLVWPIRTVLPQKKKSALPITIIPITITLHKPMLEALWHLIFYLHKHVLRFLTVFL